MTKENNTRRALLASIISLLLCVTMLIGSTFAWFTDTDTTAVNKIVAGNLDIEIVDEKGDPIDSMSFVDANGNKDILWEPGATFRTERFKIANKGNLAIKYKVEINNTKVSDNKLNEVISFKLLKITDEGLETIELGTKDYRLDSKATTTEWDIRFDENNKPLAIPANLITAPMYIEAHMDENAGNEYQGLTMDNISITVYATQDAAEFDSNGNTYDENAEYDDNIVAVNNADEFIKAFSELEKDQVVTLTSDIDMTGEAWTPVDNKSFTLNGNNHTIKGLNGGMVDHSGSASITIKNVTFDGLTDNSTTNYAGIIADADTCSYINMTNVAVENSDISSAKYAAGFVAYTSGYGNDYDGPVNASHNFTNCRLVNSKITGGGSTGGLVGHCGGNTATTTTIDNFQLDANNTIIGEDNAHTGIVIGTAHVGEIIITNTPAAENADGIGRFVPGTTGKLTVNGVEKTAFER